MEEWKDIKGYNGDYQISNFGRVKSFKRYKQGKFLKNTINTHGYLYVNLYDKNIKCNNSRIHILVWEHFGSEKRDGRKIQVDHIDNNKSNSRIDNLQLLSARENLSKQRKIEKKTSKYTGVSFVKKTNKWMSCIYKDKNYNLGSFDDEYDAHLAYKKELQKLC